MNNKLKGVGVDIVTPFHKEGNIDFNSFEKIINHSINNGVDYIVLFGSSGEGETLTKDEKIAIINFVIDIVDKKLKIVVALGGNSTQRIVNLKDSIDVNFDAILSVCPYYNQPTQKGIFMHFKTIASICPTPLVIYNSPQKTGVNIEAETVIRLAEEVENIIGICDNSTNLLQTMKIIQKKPENFLYIAANDLYTLPMLSLGADGITSVIANAFPGEVSEMVKDFKNRKINNAMLYHYNLLNMINAIYTDGHPAGIKALLENMELCQNNLRLPHVKVGKNNYRIITEAYNEFINIKELKYARTR